jgi:hypothetical protein
VKLQQRRVFVIQQPVPTTRGWVPNLEPATDFGAIHFIFQGDERPTTAPDVSFIRAWERLKDFDQNVDCILWPNSGDPAAVFATLLLLGRRLDIRKVTFLMWQRGFENGIRYKNDGFYTPITFKLPGMLIPTAGKGTYSGS